MKKAILSTAAASAALVLLFAGTARASVTYGPIWQGTPSYGIDDPSNAGLSGDLLIYDSGTLQGAQWAYDQSPYNDGTGAYYELVLKNDLHGKMCIDDRGGTSGTQIAIKDCNSSASQAWYAPCYVDTASGTAEPTLVDARGKAIRLTSSHIPVLGVISGGQGDSSFMWREANGMPHMDPSLCP